MKRNSYQTTILLFSFALMSGLAGVVRGAAPALAPPDFERSGPN